MLVRCGAYLIVVRGAVDVLSYLPCLPCHICLMLQSSLISSLCSYPVTLLIILLKSLDSPDLRLTPFCFASFLSSPPKVLRVGIVKLDLDSFLLEVLGSVESNAQLYLFFIMIIWGGIMVLLLCTLIIILFKMDICVLGFSMWF